MAGEAGGAWWRRSLVRLALEGGGAGVAEHEAAEIAGFRR